MTRKEQLECVVTLEPVDIERLLDYVKLAFKGDKELHKYHIHPQKPGSTAGAGIMARHTVEGIMAQAHVSRLHAFKVMYHSGAQSQMVGFTVVGYQPNPMLFSFGIQYKHRRWEVLKGWMGALKRMLGDCYTIPLWNKNTRAIQFFELNGFKKHFVNEEYTILCQSH